jgi:hypothetical protein
MPGKITYIRFHHERPFEHRLPPPAPISDRISGLGCRVRTNRYKYTEKTQPLAGFFDFGEP